MHESIPGVNYTPSPRCTYMTGKFPNPVNCLSHKFPGVFRGGMVTPGIDSCITCNAPVKVKPTPGYRWGLALNSEPKQTNAPTIWDKI